MASFARARWRRAVTPIKLFFDLVYVFAASQLSLHLFENAIRRDPRLAAVALAGAKTGQPSTATL